MADVVSRRGGFSEAQMDQIAEEANLYQAVRGVLRFFVDDGNLPDDLAQIHNQYAHLAVFVAVKSPQDPETTVAVRKLLDSKEAAFRAARCA
jgi:hypothetical protein